MIIVNYNNHDYYLQYLYYWDKTENILIADVALERDLEGSLVLSDMGEGVPFRAGVFDGAVSVSAIQWLFNADKKSHVPIKRIYKFFSTLYAALVCTLSNKSKYTIN